MSLFINNKFKLLFIIYLKFYNQKKYKNIYN